MRRVMHDEDGAVAVMVALLMVVLLGMTALVVDVGMVYAERAQLQNGADAAALAIAQDCAFGNCKSPTVTANKLAGENSNDGVSAAAPVISTLDRTVTVTTRTRTADGGAAVHHWFAPILGIDSTAVAARATASWGSPSQATVFPFAVAKCLFDENRAGQEVLVADDPSCLGSKKGLPGAFGWLDDDGKDGCTTRVTSSRTIEGEPGKSGPGGCEIDGRTILLPVYDDSWGNGKKVGYSIHGFAAFQVYGHCWPSDKPAGCKYTGLKGRFMDLVSLENLDSYGVEELGGPSLNASFVKLSK